jgi:DNA-binding CsgD family transcriptional regulator
MGRPCHEVVQGVTPGGRHLCGPNCPVQVSCRELRAPHRFEMIVRHPDGSDLWLEATTFVVIDQDDRGVVVHMLAESVSQGKPEASVPDSRIATRRELDVLAMLAEGLSTAEIASGLGLSSATVRNHVQNLLFKLGAHSRAEAVIVGLKSGLVRLH